MKSCNLPEASLFGSHNVAHCAEYQANSYKTRVYPPYYIVLCINKFICGIYRNILPIETYLYIIYSSFRLRNVRRKRYVLHIALTWFGICSEVKR